MATKSETTNTGKRKTVKEYGKQVTEYGKKQVSRAKAYGATMREAYEVGYKDGWAAYERLPKVRGRRTAAVVGYRNGMKNHKKLDKYRSKQR